MGQKGWLIDLGKCTGCESCTVACKSEWNTAPLESPLEFKPGCSGELPDAPEFTGCLATPKHVSYRAVIGQESGTYPHPVRLFITSACNHCDKPACLASCPLSDKNDPANPNNVITKRASDGAVLINQETCIGCQYCVWACPYGAPRFNEVTKKVEKCTFCVHRVDDGLLPACVTTCVGRALYMVEDFSLAESGLNAPPRFSDPKLTTPAVKFVPR
ncbi:MAG: 4Fe-4S dicluster domain-containing protein [Deltaproteobacteria bacterium]|nr:4Fe-4S dicluster domain-containing protein [Deltaproteobacteria bacterium]